MTTEEKIAQANISAARNNNTVLTGAEMDTVIASAQPRFMVQSGLVEGDRVTFYAKGAANVLVNKVQTPIVGMYGTVVKKGAPTPEERLIFMPGLIRQDPEKGFTGLMQEARFATTDMNKLIAEFIATGEILVELQWQEKPTPRTRNDGTPFVSKQKFLTLKKV